MESVSLTELVEQKLAAAREAHNGRAAVTIHGGHEHELRQTIVALVAEQQLSEHEGPGEATLQVLHGRVRLSTHSSAWEGSAGDYLVIPPERHSLLAIEDSAILLTVSTRLTR